MTTSPHVYDRRAPIEHEIHPLLVSRWSPRAFVAQDIELSHLRQIFEAARWAASCVNEQPWRFVVARRGDSERFAQAVDLLAAGNQPWAKDAGALVLGVSANLLSRNQSPNAWAAHDLGMSVAHIYLQAQSMGYHAHAMGGFDAQKARVAYGIPDDHTPLVMIAIGRASQVEDIDRSRLARELSARTRKPQDAFVFTGSWGQPLASGHEVQIDEILSFWCGEYDADGLVHADKRSAWWKKDEAFDKAIAARFGEIHQQICDKKCESWLTSARGALAYIIVLDQFSRNMFRGTARMFASDSQALAAAKTAVAAGLDRGIAGEARGFFYLPFMHSEKLEEQDLCISHFERFADESAERLRETLAGSLKYAHAHKAIIKTWGRFPHRNAVLGRESSPEEVVFLAAPNSSF